MNALASRNDSRKPQERTLIGIPCLLRGGTEMQTLLLIRALTELGYEVEVCCYFEADEQVVGEFQVAGAGIHLLGWSRTIGARKFIHSLAAFFREKSPRIVHIQYMAPGFMPIVAARLARVPVVLATVHQPATPYGFKALFLLRLSALLTNKFTCVSEAVERSWFGDSCLLDTAQLRAIAGRRHFTIPNAVDIRSIDNALGVRSSIVVATAAQLTGKIVVGAMGRMSREKGFDILLRAFAVVRQDVPLHSAHLLIVGSGSQLANLQALAQQLGIIDAITWTGPVSWQEAIGCLGIMDVVVVPSRFEGFGLTAVEAMACGKPVVASDVDGLAEIIRDGDTGCLATTEDVWAFARILRDLLKNGNRRKAIGIRARRHVEEHYTYPRFREQFRVLYELAIGDVFGFN